MMISPASYVEEHKNDSFEELIKEREELIASIKKYEKIVLHDKDKESQAWNYCPGPDVYYQVELEYLAELCNFMKEKYRNEKVWGIDE